MAQVAALYFLGLYETRAVLRAAPAPRAHRRRRGAPGAPPDRGLLLPPGPGVPALDLRRVRRPSTPCFLLVWRLGCSALLGGYPRAPRAGGRDERRGGRGDRGHPRAAVARARRRRCRRRQPERDAARRARRRPGARAARRPARRSATRHDVDEVIIASDATWQDELLDALQPHAGHARARLGGAVAVRDPDRAARDAPPARHSADRGVCEDVPGGAGSGHQAGLRAAFAAVLLVVIDADHAARRARGAPHVARAGDLPPATRRARRASRSPSSSSAPCTTRRRARPGPVLATEDDPRVTPLGRAAARDAARRAAAALERAARRHELRRAAARAAGVRRGIRADIQGYTERFKVRPGLTGYAQVNGEYHTSAPTKLKYDLAYIHNRSLWLDLRILSETDEGDAHAAGRVAGGVVECAAAGDPTARRRAARLHRGVDAALDQRHADRRSAASACWRSSESRAAGTSSAGRRSTGCCALLRRLRAEHARERPRAAGGGGVAAAALDAVGVLRGVLVAARPRAGVPDRPRRGGRRGDRRGVRRPAALHRRRLVPRRARPPDAGAAARAGRGGVRGGRVLRATTSRTPTR